MVTVRVLVSFEFVVESVYSIKQFYEPYNCGLNGVFHTNSIVVISPEIDFGIKVERHLREPKVQVYFISRVCNCYKAISNLKRQTTDLLYNV